VCVGKHRIDISQLVVPSPEARLRMQPQSRPGSFSVPWEQVSFLSAILRKCRASLHGGSRITGIKDGDVCNSRLPSSLRNRLSEGPALPSARLATGTDRCWQGPGWSGRQAQPHGIDHISCASTTLQKNPIQLHAYHITRVNPIWTDSLVPPTHWHPTNLGHLRFEAHHVDRRPDG
jgi:hypothetical protein